MYTDKNETRTGLVLYSGGIDSTISTLFLASDDVELVGLSINYPGRPKGEIKAARRLSRCLPFSQMIELSFDSDSQLTVPHYHSSPSEGWVPYRNFLFWAIAAHKAALIGATFIAAGHDNNDERIYTDASPGFFDALRTMLKFSGKDDLSQNIDIELPMLSLTDNALYELMASEPYRSVVFKTWSCWRDTPSPCGLCGSCKARNRFLSRVRI